jgi:uncharacterized membrane protein YkoI
LVVIFKRNTLSMLMLLGAVLAVQPAAAQPHEPTEEVSAPGDKSDAGEKQPIQDLDSTVARVRKQTGGRVLAAETKFIEGRPVHVIRVLTPNGKVRIFQIDAATGKQLP